MSAVGDAQEKEIATSVRKTLWPGPTRVAEFALTELLMRGTGDRNQYDYSLRDVALVGLAYDMVDKHAPVAHQRMEAIEKLRNMQLATERTLLLGQAFFDQLVRLQGTSTTGRG